MTDQHGMFCYTGLTPAQCERLIRGCGIYIYRTGRMNVSAVADTDVDRVAEAVAEAEKE